MTAMNLNIPTYTLSATSSSSAVTLLDTDVNNTAVNVYNAGTVPVCLLSGATSAPTAVFPTSATVPVNGTVIAPGAIETLSKNTTHKYIAGITASGAASVYIQCGAGE